MRKSIWFPRWYVVVPVLLPLLVIAWFGLGMKLGMNVWCGPDDPPLPPPAPPPYPAWFLAGYNDVLWVLIMAVAYETCPAIRLMRHADAGIDLLIPAYVLVLYAISVFGKARQRRRSSKYELIF